MKERIRSVYKELIQVYGRVPVVLMRDIVYAVTFWINIFPAKDAVSATQIPRSMITGQSVKFTKNCLLDFGEYVHTHEDGENSMDSRTLKALALCPTSNSQGGHYFLNLQTVRVITCFTWTTLPLPTRIRKLVRRPVRQSPITL